MSIKIPDYPENPTTFGERIRKIRLDKGLYAKELAEIIGVTEDSVLNWEKDRVKPRKDLMERLNMLYRVK